MTSESVAQTNAAMISNTVVRSQEKWAFLGDSLTDGFTWPQLMIQAMKEAGKPVPWLINAAAGGDTAGERLNRLDDYVLKYSPTQVFIFLTGGNDAGKKRTPEQYAADMDEIMRRIKEKRIPVVVLIDCLPGPKHQEDDDEG